MEVYFEILFAVCVLAGVLEMVMSKQNPLLSFISGFSTYAGIIAFFTFVYFMYKAIFL